MSDYSQIDSILADWAQTNGLHWYTEYQDTEVRTLYLGGNRRDRIQIAVDAPHDAKTLVRIGQNRNGLWRLNRVEQIATSVDSLATALDQALHIANAWMTETG